MNVVFCEVMVDEMAPENTLIRYYNFNGPPGLKKKIKAGFRGSLRNMSYKGANLIFFEPPMITHRIVS